MSKIETMDMTNEVSEVIQEGRSANTVMLLYLHIQPSPTFSFPPKVSRSLLQTNVRMMELSSKR